MLKKRVFSLLALFLGIMLVFAFIGCKADPDLEEDDPNGLYGSSWPSNSTLTKYGLDGMSQPTGATDISWVDYASTYYAGYSGPVLTISFGGTAATDTAVQEWFGGQGWTAEGGAYMGTSSFIFSKGTWSTYYGFANGSGTIVAGDQSYF